MTRNFIKKALYAQQLFFDTIKISWNHLNFLPPKTSKGFQWTWQPLQNV
jgi:hypothetical protein